MGLRFPVATGVMSRYLSKVKALSCIGFRGPSKAGMVETLIHMGWPFSPALSMGVGQSRWVVRLVQAGLDIGRLKIGRPRG